MKKTRFLAVLLFIIALLAAGTAAADPWLLPDAEADTDNMQGTWYNTDFGFELCVPSGWVLEDLTDMDDARDDGVRLIARGSGDEALVFAAQEAAKDETTAVLYRHMNALSDDFMNACLLHIHEIPVIYFEIPDQQTAALALIENGMLCLIQYSPVTGEAPGEAPQQIFSSLRTARTP